MTVITVDEKLCTGCGICSRICPGRIIIKPEDEKIPYVPKELENMCINCGHCEAFCPENALLAGSTQGVPNPVLKETGEISTEDIEIYLKKRRSIRNYKKNPVSREIVLNILDIARYAPSGCNAQSVGWTVVYEREKVRKISELTIEWMKTLVNTPHPMSSFAPGLIDSWESGYDVICRGAPHLVVAHVPENNPLAQVDSIISLSHFEIAGQAFGVGSCWAGFVAGAAMFYEPISNELEIPKGRKFANALMFGYPKYTPHAIPKRKPLDVSWI